MKRFQFSLRDAAWLFLLCAVAVGWWTDRVRSLRWFSDKWYDSQKENTRALESIAKRIDDAEEETRDERRLKEYFKSRADELEKELEAVAILPAEE